MNNKPADHRSPFISLRFVYWLVIGLTAISTPAQTSVTDGSTPLGLSPGAPAGSYALSGFENVNLFNGNLNFRLPLLPVGGRGSAGYTMMLAANLKGWRVSRVHKDLPNGDEVNWDTPTQTGWTGVSGRYEVGHLSLRGSGVGFEGGQGTCPRHYQYGLTRLTFSSADGTEYEFRDQLTGGEPKRGVGNGCILTGANRGTVFISTDGTATTFISDTPIVDSLEFRPNATTPSGYLMLRDGTRYRIDSGLVTWIRDRNGNKVSFTYTSTSMTVTDSLNRTVVVNYNVADTVPYGLCDQIIFKGFGGAQRIIRVSKATLADTLRPNSGFAIKTKHELFPDLFFGQDTSSYNPERVSRVWLPNSDASAQHQQYYQFYYNDYGELARVELPTGGAIEYDTTPGSGVVAGEPPQIYRRVSERRVYPDGSSGASFASRTSFSVESASGVFDPHPWSSTITSETSNREGTILERSRHFFVGSGLASLFQANSAYVYSGWNESREIQTELLDTTGPKSSATVLRRSATTWQQRAPVAWWPAWAAQTGLFSGNEPSNDPRVSLTTATIEPAGPNLVSKTILEYDDTVPFNNQNKKKEYDFGSGVAGSLLRETRTTYVTAADYTGPIVHLCSLPTQVSILDGLGIERSRTSFEYDNYNADGNHNSLSGRPNISGFDSSFNTSYTPRGNVTATTHYLLNSSGAVTGSISNYAQFDIAGNVVKAIDGRGFASTIDYTDRFGAPDGEARANAGSPELNAAGQSSYAFATMMANALGHTSYVQFDYSLGKPVDAEDANGTAFSGAYSDPLDRPSRLVKASNRELAFQSETLFSYDDVGQVVTTTSDLRSFGDHVLKSQALYDGLGRTVETRQYEGGGNYIAARNQFDALGRTAQSSNPFRPWKNELPIWNTTAFDALGRVKSLTTADGAVATTTYNGNEVVSTDQTGKKRKSVSDALGRLTRLYEDPNGSNWLTSYEYDALDHLTRVVQGDQVRTLVYDSLSRLSSATNPENGTSTYSYDNNGNLLTRVDARGTITNLAYDALNRPVSKSYQNDPAGTSPVNYFYDEQALPAGSPAGFARGSSTSRLVAVTYDQGASTGDYLGYDVLGRPVLKIQRTGNNNYPATATYSVSGRISTSTYPSGHSVTYNYDSAGRLGDRDTQAPAMAGNLGDGVMRTYSSAITYSDHNLPAQEKLGTDIPIYNKLFYNSRGQLAEIRESTSPNNTSWNRGAIINHYSDQCWGSCSGQNMTDNNGSLKRQDVYIPNDDQVTTYATWADSYSYDNLNRLSRVHEYTSNGTNDWQQTYNYDRWGNRTIDQSNTWGANIPKPNFGVNSSNNRLTAPVSYTLAYDAVGNLITDSYTGSGQRTFDAENRLTSAQGTSNWSYYTYDADGHRIKRTSNNVETWQVYGIGGELLAEYPAGGVPTAPQKEYGYRNGELLVAATPMTSGNNTNVALAANGGSAIASSYFSNPNYGTYLPSYVNDGSRKALNGAIWMDNSYGSFPDWIEVDFSGSKTINEIDVVTQQDDNQNPVEPTLSQTFSLWGITSFDLQYWNGSSWVTVPGASVTGNNKVWRQFTFASITTSKIRVVINNSSDHIYSRVVEIEAWTSPATVPQTTNFALTTNGGTALASSYFSNPAYGTYLPSSVIDGSRKATNGAIWLDNTIGSFPDWIEVDFNGSKTISEIDVVTQQDDLQNPTEPTLTQTFLNWGITAFEVQYWNGSAWTNVPGGSVTNNNKVWRQFTFASITTSKIRVVINDGMDHTFSRVVEVEAWGLNTSTSGAGVDIEWLVTDQLGTPRMIFDKTGSLVNTRRHDYLPFGEELQAGTGVRSSVQGYAGSEGIRQKFSQKERDEETGLDYFLARYFSSAQGRFISPDPLLASGRPTNPQTWNRYSYVLNNPLSLVDPNGLAENPPEEVDQQQQQAQPATQNPPVEPVPLQQLIFFTYVPEGPTGRVSVSDSASALLNKLTTQIANNVYNTEIAANVVELFPVTQEAYAYSLTLNIGQMGPTAATTRTVTVASPQQALGRLYEANDLLVSEANRQLSQIVMPVAGDNSGRPNGAIPAGDGGTISTSLIQRAREAGNKIGRQQYAKDFPYRDPPRCFFSSWNYLFPTPIY